MKDVVSPTTQHDEDLAIRGGKTVVTGDAFLLARSAEIDVLVDVTGSVEFGARVAFEAFRHGKDVVLMNAEIDATIGPILQAYADKVRRDLLRLRWRRAGRADQSLSLGQGPRPHAARNGQHQRPAGSVSQSDHTKGIRREVGPEPGHGHQLCRWLEDQLRAGDRRQRHRLQGDESRGMSRGMEYADDVMKIGKLYDIDEVRKLGGVIDYVVGTPLTKVYVLAEHPDPKQQHYLNLYKMGEGPLYSFFVPYHLVHFEVPYAIARVVLFRDSLAKPLGGPVVEVCAVRKARFEGGRDTRRLRHVYDLRRSGQRRRDVQQALPARRTGRGLYAEQDIPKDAVITYNDVTFPRTDWPISSALSSTAYSAARPGWKNWLRCTPEVSKRTGNKHESRSILRRSGDAHPRCGGYSQAHGAYRPAADVVARDEVLCALRPQGFHSLLGLQSGGYKELFPELQRVRLERFRAVGRRQGPQADQQRHPGLAHYLC